MNVIDERDKRTATRKKAKAQFDKIITLSAKGKKAKRVRLLDEGAVVYSGGELWFYIMKGTLDKYLANLPDDYVGSINLGHQHIAEAPWTICGTWTKSDLHLVDIGNGRKGLDVDVRVDYGHPLVQAIARNGIDVGVSVEMKTHRNEAASLKYNVEMVDNLFIHDFAIVGECGNVNSSGLNLGGKEMDIKTLSVLLNQAEDDELSIDALNEALEEGEVEAEVAEAEAEVEETEVEAEVAEEATEEETEVEAEAEAEEEDPMERVLAMLETLQASMNDLTARVEATEASFEALSTANEQLQTQLTARDAKEKAFLGKLKKLSIDMPEMGEEKPEEPKELSLIHI